MRPIAADGVTKSLGLCVLGTRVSATKTDELIEILFVADWCGLKEPCTSALPSEYDKSICVAAAMRSIAIVDVATCYVADTLYWKIPSFVVQ